MAKYSDNQNNVYDVVLSKCDIVHVISHYIKLEKKGRNYAGLCPFHDDKNLGNFFVSPDKQIYKCFACNSTGTAINFVANYERISIFEAAKKIADIEGLVIPELNNLGNKKINPKVEKAYKILDDIQKFYSLCLLQSKEASEALEYLHNRNLNDDVIAKFDIGYSLNNGNEIIDYLTKEKKYLLKEIDLTGIIDSKNGILKDKNHGRIVFPIRNSNGNVCGFSCRIYGNNKSDSKYVNSPSTIVFNKSNLLYNYSEASKYSQRFGYVYLLEGFMDVIACYKVNKPNAIGLMGTSLTKEHISLLKKLNCKIRVCLDLDAPGQKAMISIFKQFENANIPYEIVNNDVDFKFKDSDEILNNLGEDKLINFLDNLIDKPNWLINFFKKNLDLSIIENKKKLIKYFAKDLSGNNLDSQYYLALVSKALGVNSEVILNTIKEEKFLSNISEVKENPNDIIKSKETSIKNIENNNLNNSKVEINRLYNLEKVLLFYIIKQVNAYHSFKENNLEFSYENYKTIYKMVDKYHMEFGDEKEYNNDVFYNNLNESNFENKDDIRKTFNDLITHKVYVDYSTSIFNELVSEIAKEKSKIEKDNFRKDLLQEACSTNSDDALNASAKLTYKNAKQNDSKGGKSWLKNQKK